MVKELQKQIEMIDIISLYHQLLLMEEILLTSW